MSIRVGTKFRYVIADGNYLWKVTNKVKNGVWEAVCIDEDYKGQVQFFSTKQIENDLRSQSAFKRIKDEQESFYGALVEGQTVHYDNGFKQYVECIAVKKDSKNVLLPVALKGNWREHDLPRRLSDGSVSDSYYAKKIWNKETFTPNVTCIVESPVYVKLENKSEVKILPRIDLVLPSITDRQAQIREFLYILTDIKKIVEETERSLMKGDEKVSISDLKQTTKTCIENKTVLLHR